MILRKAQSSTEYAVMFACIIAALVVMQTYFRRGLSGKIKSLTDSNLGAQFDPWKGDYRSVTAQIGDTVEATVVHPVVRIDNTTATEYVDWYEYVFSVTGPQALDYQGTEVIPADPARQPLRISSYQDSSVDWADLRGALGGSGGSGGSGGIIRR